MALAERYEISAICGVSRLLAVDISSVHKYVHGARTMNDEAAEKAAVMLDESPAWVLLCLAVERQRDDKLARQMRDILLAAANREKAA